MKKIAIVMLLVFGCTEDNEQCTQVDDGVWTLTLTKTSERSSGICRPVVSFPQRFDRAQKGGVTFNDDCIGESDLVTSTSCVRHFDYSCDSGVEYVNVKCTLDDFDVSLVHGTCEVDGAALNPYTGERVGIDCTYTLTMVKN